jgi:hypothetical protein
MENEETIVDIDPTNDAEVNDNDTDDTDPSENPDFKEYWIKKVENLEATNKKLYARVKGSEKKPLQKTNSDLKDMPDDIDKKFEKLELKTEGYNEDEIEFLSQYGGKKALSNPIIKTALETLREKAKAENAVVDSSENTSSIEKKYTEAQLRAMSPDELEELIKSSK